MDAAREYRRALGRKIQDARKRAGLTQQDLGDEVNLTRTSITNVERGNQSVSVWLLHQIATALDCAPVDLLPSEHEPDRPGLPADVPAKTAALIRRLDAVDR